MKKDLEGKVVIERSARAKRMRITVKPGAVHVSVPRGVPLARAQAFVCEQEDWIRRHLTRLEHRDEAGRRLLAELPAMDDPEAARKKITYRLRLLAMETGLSYSRLTIRNQKTRWGSCSSDNAISLNIQIARLPEPLMDYVILHELVHTRVKGHGSDFWQKLDTFVGDAKMLRQELRKYILVYM